MVIFGYTIPEQQIIDLALFYGGHMLGAFIILLIGYVAARIVRSIAEGVMKRAKLDLILINFISKIIYGLLMIFVVIAALNKLGVQTASLIAVLGAAGLAIGLALQGSLSNFAAGIMIIVLRHFRIGDVVTVNNVTGIVEDMNIFTTTLHTPTNERLVIPNSMLTSNILTNITANKRRRVDIVVGVGYGDDLDKVADVLSGIITAQSHILPDPAPIIEVDALADNSVNVAVRVWVNTADHGPVRTNLLKEIKQQFDRNGISIPYPQREIQVNFNENAAKLLEEKRTPAKVKPAEPAAKTAAPRKKKS